LAARQRALVLCRDEARMTALDAALWQCTEPNWLPHGTTADGDAPLQPIWLATDASTTPNGVVPNGARYLFLIDGAETADLNSFERVFDLFAGKDGASVAGGGERWSATKAAGHSLTYWQQGGGGWEKGA